MKKEQMKYESPRIKVINCETEGVFCTSKTDLENYGEDMIDDGWD